MKLGEILFGKFKYTRVPASSVGGGTAEYALEPFEAPSAPQDVINGTGFHVRGQLRLTQPGLVALYPAGPILDFDMITQDELDPFISGGEGSLQS